jgi:SAM-dependent methyltransferase
MYQALCTEFYDIDKCFAEADEVNFYKQFLDKDKLILEPMCGSGRLLIPLIQEGYQIHGLDNSIPMLDNCRDRARRLGLEPVLFEASIETMQLPHKYHLMLIPLGSFQLLYPRSMAFNALQNFRKHLHARGRLILDLFVPWDALYENNEEEFIEKEVSTSDGGVIKHKSHNHSNKYEQYCHSNSTYTKIINNKVVSEENEEMYLSWYYRYEMELILEKYGFNNVTYKEEFFRNENHMIFIAEN